MAEGCSQFTSMKSLQNWLRPSTLPIERRENRWVIAAICRCMVFCISFYSWWWKNLDSALTQGSPLSVSISLDKWDCCVSSMSCCSCRKKRYYCHLSWTEVELWQDISIDSVLSEAYLSLLFCFLVSTLEALAYLYLSAMLSLIKPWSHKKSPIWFLIPHTMQALRADSPRMSHFLNLLQVIK